MMRLLAVLLFVAALTPGHSARALIESASVAGLSGPRIVLSAAMGNGQVDEDRGAGRLPAIEHCHRLTCAHGFLTAVPSAANREYGGHVWIIPFGTSSLRSVIPNHDPPVPRTLT